MGSSISCRRGAAISKSSYGTVRRLPSGRYQARVRIGGQQVTVGTFDTRKEAREAIGSLAPARSSAATTAPAPSLRDYAEQWKEHRVGHRYSTRKRDQLALDHDILPVLGDRRIDHLNTQDVQAFVNDLSARLAPTSIRRVHAVLVSVVRSAIDTGMINTDPTRGVRLPKTDTPEPNFLTFGDLERVADVTALRFRAMVLVMAWATLRIGEACGLKRDDIDLDKGTLSVRRSVTEVSGRLVDGPPKTKAGRRTLALPSSVLDELGLHLGHWSGNPWVFGGPSGRPLRASEWRRTAWYPALERAGLPRLAPHALIHSGVAYLIAAGVDPLEIARRAGHQHVSFTLARYGHLLPGADSAAARRLDALRVRGEEGP